MVLFLTFFTTELAALMSHIILSADPHYKAQLATSAQIQISNFYLYDPTSIWSALLRSSLCVAVEKRGEGRDRCGHLHQVI